MLIPILFALILSAGLISIVGNFIDEFLHNDNQNNKTIYFDFKQDVETQQMCYKLVRQKQELDRLILERQIENGNNEIKEKYKRCPNCGANLQYKNGIAKCKYCDSEWS